MQTVLLIHALVTWFMTGLIWFVQVVHYPLMAAVGSPGFAAYEAAHSRRTTWVVAPVMLAEAATAAVLVAGGRAFVPGWQSWLGLALVAVIWLSTALAQVPQHRKLGRGFDPRAHARLVSSNRLRVAAWTARSLLVAYWL